MNNNIKLIDSFSYNLEKKMNLNCLFEDSATLIGSALT